MNRSTCPFCEIDPTRVVGSNQHALAIHDNYPLAEGHTLVAPRDHVPGLIDREPNVRAAVWGLVDRVRAELRHKYRVEAFNIGINDGEAAGQTIMHAHVHIVPRVKGDVADPRGGVRWVIPDKAKYWGDV